jgi:hypothetical protein
MHPKVPRLNDLPQIEEIQVNFYDPTLADHRFNDLEMSQNFSQVREPSVVDSLHSKLPSLP